MPVSKHTAKLTVDQLKDLISYAKAQGVVKLCYDGLEIIIDSTVIEPGIVTNAPRNDDDLLFYSSN
jgi:hypothetical protein